MLDFPSDSKAWWESLHLKSISGKCLQRGGTNQVFVSQAAFRLPQPFPEQPYGETAAFVHCWLYSRNRFESLVLVLPWRKKKLKVLCLRSEAFPYIQTSLFAVHTAAACSCALCIRSDAAGHKTWVNILFCEGPGMWHLGTWFGGTWQCYIYGWTRWS